jgi:chromosome partitioning protein
MGAKIKHVGMLPVMFNPHINEHKESVAKVESAFGKAKVFKPIGTDIKLAQMFESGRPIVLMDKRTKGMKDYKSFCQELLKRIEQI